MNTLAPFHLTPPGTFHSAISLIGVVAGVIAFGRDKEISPKNLVGRIYVTTTGITCLTGFGIFQHGGFGKPHVLGVAAVAGNSRLFWRGSPPGGGTKRSAASFFSTISRPTPAAAPVFLGGPPGGHVHGPGPEGGN